MCSWWFRKAYLMLHSLSSAYRSSSFPLLLLVMSFRWLIPGADKRSTPQDRASQSKSRLVPPHCSMGKGTGSDGGQLTWSVPEMHRACIITWYGKWELRRWLEGRLGTQRQKLDLSGYCHALGNKDQCEHILGNPLEWAHSRREVSPGLAPSQSGVLSPWKSLELFFPLGPLPRLRLVLFSD